MTPEQMLSLIERKPNSPGLKQPDKAEAFSKRQAAFRHQTSLLRSEAEEWLLEQLEKGLCPTCGAGLISMHSRVGRRPWFYSCSEDTLAHRWAIYEDTDDIHSPSA